MEELKPCPFCGAPARFRSFGPADDYLMVECGKEDGACVSMQVSEASEWAHKYLAEKWNKRPGEDEWERMYTNLAIEQSREIWADTAPENKALTCAGCRFETLKGRSRNDCLYCARGWPDKYVRRPEAAQKEGDKS